MRAVGRRAEEVVVDHLRSWGYSIVATNLHLGALELDIVARLGNVVAVVEVRTRGRKSYTRALGSINHAKRQRLKRAAARLWRERYRNDLSVATIRFDAAAVFLDEQPPRVEYVRAAF